MRSPVVDFVSRFVLRSRLNFGCFERRSFLLPASISVLLLPHLSFLSYFDPGPIKGRHGFDWGSIFPLFYRHLPSMWR